MNIKILAESLTKTFSFLRETYSSLYEEIVNSAGRILESSRFVGSSPTLFLLLLRWVYIGLYEETFTVNGKEKDTMNDEYKRIECKIRFFEDLLLRSKDFNEQMLIRSSLVKLRVKQQKMYFQKYGV